MMRRQLPYSRLVIFVFTIQKHQPLFRRRALLLIIICGGLIAACSTIKIAYTNADRILFPYMDEYLDLTTAQKEFLKQELQVRLDERRNEELPIFVELLERIETLGEDGLIESEVETILNSIVEVYATTTRKTVAIVVLVLDDLNEAQIGHLSSKLNAANQRYYDKHLALSFEERKERRARRVVRRLEPWVGALTLRAEAFGCSPERYPARYLLGLVCLLKAPTSGNSGFTPKIGVAYPNRTLFDPMVG